MLVTCSQPGCKTIVMGGGRCYAHERHENRVFVRGRPFAASSTTVLARKPRERVVAFAASEPWRTVELQAGLERPSL